MSATGSYRKRKVVIYGFSLFYIVAGLNHFVNPGFYYPLIPDYLPLPGVINFASGILEIVFGAAALSPGLRKFAATGILLLLGVFVLSHIYFISIGSCVDGGLCVPEWIGWVRLVVIHPLLMWWAYFVGYKPVARDT